MSFTNLNPEIVFCGPSVWDLAVDVDRQPRPGQKVGGKHRWEGPGGHAFNAAAVTARMGNNVLLVSASGLDPRGVELRRAADDISGLEAMWSDTERTPTSLVMHLGAGPERTIISVRETSGDGAPPIGCRDLLFHANWTDLYWWEGQEEWAVSIAQMAGGNLSASVRHAQILAEWGYHLGLVIDSIDAAEVPSDTWLQAHAEHCVLTDGARGGRYWTRKDGWAYFNAQTATSVVSTCGAGDAFRAGLIVALNSGLELPAALDQANWCGAQAIGWPGGIPTGDLNYPGTGILKAS